GLLAGATWAAAGDDSATRAPRIEGVAVSPDGDELAEEVTRLTAQTLALLGTPEAPFHVRVDSAHVGPGYGIVTEGGIEAIGLFARTEGIVLDPVYTGKAAAALIAGIRSGRFDADTDVLFLHTGGAPALFAHERTLTAAFGG
ncbi:pyridoxal-phosphate dependent enzyme, partial [Microbacterium sp.]|uniref:pyridoxal-phosphate dependent enzyme n=1 Tax=Microbacterium sp. TaxID=51671 RepID=UPI003C74CE23